MSQGFKCIDFDLPDAFACKGVDSSDLLQGLGPGAVQAEAANNERAHDN